MISRILGRLLRDKHAGEARMAWNHAATMAAQSLSLSSSAFATEGTIPLKFAGRGVGEDVSPALSWSSLPAEAVELVLVMEDPDAPLSRPFVHLIAYGIKPDTVGFAEGALSTSSSGQFQLGRNTFGGYGYGGPRALPGHGPHRYVFQLFALNQALSFNKPPSLDALLAAMTGHVIARARLDAFFEQQ